MLNKKKLVIAGLIILVILALLWLIGGLTKDRREQSRHDYYLTLVKENRSLQALVEKNLVAKGINLDPISNIDEPNSQYGPADITILEEVDESSLKNYGLKISEILSPYGEPRNNEVLLVLDAIQAANPTAIKALTNTQTLHDQAISSLLSITVPQNAQVIHLILLNSIQRLSDDLAVMSQALEDPQAALQASEEYIINYILFFKAIEGVNIYFDKQGVTFDQQNIASIYDSIGIVE